MQDPYLPGTEDGGGFPGNGRKETLLGDGNILYLDCEGGYLGCISLSELTKLYALNECSLLIISYISG